MSLSQHGVNHNILYKADPNVSHTITSIRDHMSHICKRYVNQMVRVETLDGNIYEGVLVHCERGMLYISVPYQGNQLGQARGLYYNNAILPLVLYELLVITLLYT
ncbi:hypothetical protein [Paenibacillus pini]|uniref:hypothetical protein n=1 Tax=Paenibacillus pini TaxID=669461 RepID=UPI000569FF13|nr:hypothetical protein [Paenibacillus pini]